MRCSRAPRACLTSQAPENLRSLSDRDFRPCGPDVDGHARCPLHPCGPSRFSSRWPRKVPAAPNAHLAPHARLAHRARLSRPPSVRCARPALCIASKALPTHGCSRPLAPHACAAQRHFNHDSQSCGACAGDASTYWVSFVAFRDARAASRGAHTIHACEQRRRGRHRRGSMALCYLLADPPTLYYLESPRSKLSESYRVW